MQRLHDRSLLRLSPAGPDEDVRGFLQGLVTNDVRQVVRGAPVWAGLLSPQGKALFDFLVWDDGDSLLLDCEASHAAGLVRRLSLYRLRRKVEIREAEGLGVFWDAGSEAGGEGRAAADPRLEALGVRRIAPAAHGDADGSDAFRRHRLSLGVMEGAAELGQDATLWLECNAAELNGVSFSKGCYVGQENTARMNWRSNVNRRLVVVPAGTVDPKRVRIVHADLGLAVAHMRVEDMRAIAGTATLRLPDWQAAAIGALPPAGRAAEAGLSGPETGA